jgi:hypothetical protein
MEDEQEEPSITIKGDQPVSLLRGALQHLLKVKCKHRRSAPSHTDKCRLMGLFAPRVDFIPNY